MTNIEAIENLWFALHGTRPDVSIKRDDKVVVHIHNGGDYWFSYPDRTACQIKQELVDLLKQRVEDYQRLLKEVENA